MTVKRQTRRLLLVGAGLICAVAALAPSALAAPPGNVTRPTITGTPAEGQTLTATDGTWTNNPTAFQYQWQRCRPDGLGCAAIAGATQKTYVVRSADVGRTLRVRVRAVNADGAT